MERLNNTKQRSDEQLSQLQTSCLSAGGVISKTMAQTNSYRLQKFSDAINALSNEIGTYIMKKDECDVVALPARTVRCKYQLVSIITDMINTLVEMAENGTNVKLLTTCATGLENILTGLGFKLFDMPVGEVYDFTVDGFLANIKGETHSANNSKTSKKMYIESSTFGCAEQKDSTVGRIVEKANVTLTDEPTKTKKPVLKIR